ncbi:MAG TPA: ribosome-associated translation inhibitor RaiA [Candidatus Paceibacterota bacterium]
MRIQIEAKGFELTPSLTKFIEEKIGGLDRFIKRWDKDNSVITRVEVSKTTKHHQKGEIFYAEVNMDLPHKVLRVEETNNEIHTAIDRAKDRLKNEIVRLKEKATEH